jgi:hypothetical protein
LLENFISIQETRSIFVLFSWTVIVSLVAVFPFPLDGETLSQGSAAVAVHVRLDGRLVYREAVLPDGLNPKWDAPPELYGAMDCGCVPPIVVLIVVEEEGTLAAGVLTLGTLGRILLGGFEIASTTSPFSHSFPYS